MEKITLEKAMQQVNESNNFNTFVEGWQKGFLIVFKREHGWALQVDTDEYEWIECHIDNGVCTYYGSK